MYIAFFSIVAFLAHPIFEEGSAKGVKMNSLLEGYATRLSRGGLVGPTTYLRSPGATTALSY